jgi:hypothetical protein
MFGADGEKIAVQPPSPVAGPVSIKGPVFVVRTGEASVPANLLTPEICIGDRRRKSACGRDPKQPLPKSLNSYALFPPNFERPKMRRQRGILNTL